MSVFLRKYGTGTGADIIIPLIKRGVVDYAVTADYTPTSGDVVVSKDGGAGANIGTLPVINGTYGWKFVFADAELQCKSLRVTIVDSATKAVEDQCFIVETYGHASAMYPTDFSAAVLPANVTQIGGQAVGLSSDNRLRVDVAEWNDTPLATTNPLPNVAPDGSGGLPTTTKITDARLGALTDWIDGGRLDLIIDALTTALAKVPKSDGTVSLNATVLAAIANAVEAAILNEGDATPLLAAISDKVEEFLINDGDSTATLAAIAAAVATELGDGAAFTEAGGDGDHLTALATASAQTTAQNDLDLLTGTDGATLATTQGNYAPAKVSDIPTAAENFAAVLTTQLTESYAASGTAPTLAQAICLIQQSLHEFAISSTTRTVKKLDGSTTAATFTLDDDTSPTSTTRAT